MTLQVRNTDRRAGLEVRCPCCRKKVAEVLIPGGRVQVFCRSCHRIVDFETWPDEEGHPPPVAVERRR